MATGEASGAGWPLRRRLTMSSPSFAASQSFEKGLRPPAVRKLGWPVQRSPRFLVHDGQIHESRIDLNHFKGPRSLVLSRNRGGRLDRGNVVAFARAGAGGRPSLM